MLYDTNDINIIIPLPTGNTYTNQVGGSACLHTSVTGTCIPFSKWKENQRDPFLGLYNFPYDEAKVKSFLKEFGLWKILEAYPTEGKEYFEGWVWARIRKDARGNNKAPAELRPFAGTICVVAYPNSD
jgi:hypothetical protein